MISKVLKSTGVVALSLACTFAKADGSSRCANLAKNSKNKLLILAFEGAGQYEESGVDQLYSSQKSRKNYPRYSSCALFNCDYITKLLLTRLVARKNGTQFDVVVFSEGSSSEGVTCGSEWMDKKGAIDRKLMIIGHSAGGPPAGEVAEDLAERHIPVDSVFTLDATNTPGLAFLVHMSRPSDVSYWGNFYQSSSMFNGTSDVSGAQNVPVGTTHTLLPGDPAVVKAVSARVAKDVGNG